VVFSIIEKRVARGEAAPEPSSSIGLADRTAVIRRRTCVMLIDFFLHLKAAKLPVSTREFLTLLDALKHDVASGSHERLSTSSRAPAWSRDEALYGPLQTWRSARTSMASTRLFDIKANIPGRMAAQARRRWPDRRAEKALIEALGGWDKLMKTLKARAGGAAGDATRADRKWIGTAGTSPFGAYGYNPGRCAVSARRAAANRSAGQGLGRADVP